MKQRQKEKLKLPFIIIGVAIFLVVAFFIIYKVIPPLNVHTAANTIFSPMSFALLPSNVILSSGSSDLALNNSVSGGYLKYPDTNTTLGFVEGYSNLLYYQNPSGDQVKSISSTVYAYNSSTAADASFSKNKKFFLDSNCVPFDVPGLSADTRNVFGCSINVTGSSSLYFVCFSTRGFFGGVSLGEKSLQQSQQSLENETAYYAGIVAANMNRFVYKSQ